jgi:hypothetical protein
MDGTRFNIVALEAQLASTEDQPVDLEAQLESKDQLINQLLELVSQKGKKVESLQAQVASMEAQVASMEAQRVALEEHHGWLLPHLSTQDQYIQSLEEERKLDLATIEFQRSIMIVLARTAPPGRNLRHFIPSHPDPSARIEGMVEQRQGATLQNVANGAAAAAAGPSDRREQQDDAASAQLGAREPVVSSLKMSNADIAEGLKALRACALDKGAQLLLQLEEHKENEPEAGTAEHRSYKKALLCLKRRRNYWKIQMEFLDDQAMFLSSFMGDSLENPREHANIFEEFDVQLRMAKELTKLLCDLVEEGEALELQLMEMTPSQHGNYRDLKDRLRAVTADLGRFDSAIGGDENTRPRFYIDMIMGPPEEGSDDEASDDEASDDEASDDGASDDGASDDEASDDEASDDGAPRKRIRRTSVGTASPRASQIA